MCIYYKYLNIKEKTAMIRQERLRELFSYDGNHLYWRVDKSKGRMGDRAGCYGNGTSYVLIGVDGKLYGEHRLVWIYHYGVIPKGKLIDHIDKDCKNNSLSNLRLATMGQNLRNRKLNKNNKSGYVGVSLDEKTKKWHANICLNYKIRNLGSFSKLEDAVNARISAEAEIYTDGFCCY